MLCARFGFLARLESYTPEEIKDVLRNIVIIYNEDLDDSFADELIQFAAFIPSFKQDAKMKVYRISKVQFMYKLIIEKV